MDPKKNRAFRLRNLTIEELQKTLDEHKKELSALRVAQVTSGVASKICKIRVVRKAIAKQLSILNQKKRQEIKDAFSSRSGIKAYNEKNKTNFSLRRLPKDLKARKTRAIRRKITKHQRNRVLPKLLKRRAAFPQRSFALKA